MEYTLIILLQVLGASLHVLQKIAAIKMRHAEWPMKQIFISFWLEDWNTLFGSLIILLLNLVTHFIVDNYGQNVASTMDNYHLYAFAVALLLGYAGQRLIYRFLGTAEKALNKKIDSIENK